MNGLAEREGRGREGEMAKKRGGRGREEVGEKRFSAVSIESGGKQSQLPSVSRTGGTCLRACGEESKSHWAEAACDSTERTRVGRPRMCERVRASVSV